jgi:hypothetical protein
MGIVMATFPTANLILLQGDPEFCTLAMRLDDSNAIKERDETNNIASKDIWIIPTPPNPLPGDYNYDGSVDTADYVVWRNALGKNFDHRADHDGDEDVDRADYDFWRAQFGMTRQATGASELAAAAFVSDQGSPPTDSFASRTIRITAVDSAFDSFASLAEPTRRSETRPSGRLKFGFSDSSDLLLSVARTLHESVDQLGSDIENSTVAAERSKRSVINRELEEVEPILAAQL